MSFTKSELEAYLDEGLTPDEMSTIESALRSDPKLATQIKAINSRRDAGLHTLGEIWRRHRISCPTRETLGSYLLETLDADHAAYIDFHLRQVGCRFCNANLDDLQRQRREANTTVTTRRKKYFQSSAGYLRGDESPG